MPRLNIERQKELEPLRMLYAIKRIEEITGIVPIVVNGNELQFYFKEQLIIFYPYSGWHTGKGIKDGRGLNKLLKQLNEGVAKLVNADRET